MPRTVCTTAFDLAHLYLGVREVPGLNNNPLVVSMLQLEDRSIRQDETPWCSGFVNWIAWHLQLPRSKSLAARSWLEVGAAMPLDRAVPGFDVVVLSRDGDPALGHVGFFAGRDEQQRVRVLGGNQHNEVSIEAFPLANVVGVRRLLQ